MLNKVAERLPLPLLLWRCWFGFRHTWVPLEDDELVEDDPHICSHCGLIEVWA